MSVPVGLNVREITSQEATCEAYGFGYRKKNARDTMDHWSLHEQLIPRDLRAD